MKKQLIHIFILFFPAILVAQESCYKVRLDAALKSYYDGRYQEAIAKFGVAKSCSDANNAELDKWIAKASGKLKKSTTTHRIVTSGPDHVQENVNPKIETVALGNRSYKAVQIGLQFWLAENLDVDRFQNGDIIPEAKTNEEWINAARKRQPAWCYYNNNPEYRMTFGKLYNWYAVNDPRGLAPSGWHIPVKEEWKQLEKFLGDHAGDKLKTPLGNWGKDYESNPYKSNPNNKSGFTGLPSCFRFPDGDFSSMNCCADWWSLSEKDNESAWSYELFYSFGFLGEMAWNKGRGFSVRCIRDDGKQQILPNRDSDGDGFDDQKDKCPLDYSTLSNGCPVTEEVEVTIDAKSTWVDCRIEMNGVTNFQIKKMEGSWTVDSKTYQLVDGWGYKNENETSLKNLQGAKTVKEAAFGTLLAKIGSNGPPFAILGLNSFVNPGGRLYMKINDEALIDNAGKLKLTLEVIRTR